MSRKHRQRKPSEVKETTDDSLRWQAPVSRPTALQRYRLIGAVALLIGWFAYLLYVAFAA